MPQRSLRAQILSRLVAPLLLMLAVVGVGGYYFINKPTVFAYDQSLANGALAVAQHVVPAGAGLRFDLSPQAEQVVRTDRYDSIFFAVLDSDGRHLGGDAGLPLPQDGGVEDGSWIGYDTSFRGRSLRAVALHRLIGDKGVTVVMAESRNKRQSVAWGIGLGMLVPEMLLAAGLMVIIWYGVARGLAPLEKLREDLQARSHRDLSPLDEAPIVEEVRPMVTEINGLLRRLDLASDTQQRFIANAAHQLRTPLAGLQTQLELVLQETDDGAREGRLKQCRQATMRTARLVNQLLALSAADARGRGEHPHGDADLAVLCRDRADGWVHRAIARDIDLGLELDVAQVHGDALLIGEMIANLVDNALAYTPPGGRVTLRCGQQHGCAVLSIVDNGPGIPEADRSRVVERFFRLPGSPGGGSGLGLAIVREIADNHGARVEIADAPGEDHGTLIEIRFPQRRSAPGALDSAREKMKHGE